MELFLRICIGILVECIVSIVVARILPKLKDKEKRDNLLYTENKEVAMNKQLSKIFMILVPFSTIIGLCVTIFPQICEFLEINYVITLMILWLILIFDNIMLMLILIKIKYNEEYFEYINVFGFKKKFNYDDIIQVIDNGKHIRIFTKTKKILLLGSFSGLRSFVDYIKEKNNNI